MKEGEENRYGAVKDGCLSDDVNGTRIARLGIGGRRAHRRSTQP